MQNILNRIIKLSLYSLVFLVPLFWLPFSFEAFEFNKQYLLFALVSVGFFAWLAKMIVVDQELKFRFTIMDAPVLVFLAVAALSAVFSVDRVSSSFGFYGRFNDGLIGLAAMAAMYFLITNNTGFSRSVAATKPVSSGVRGQGEETPNATPKRNDGHRNLLTPNGLIETLIYSAFFTVLISYFSIFSLWEKIPLPLPQLMRQRIFNPIGASMESLAMFLAVIAVFLAGMLLFSKQSKRLLIFNWLLLALSLFLLLIVDFIPAWIVLSAVSFLFSGFAIWQRIFRENVNKLLLPIFLIIIAVIGIFFNPFQDALGNILTLPKEIVLDQENSWKVGLGSSLVDIKSGFLGSGVGTFHYDFAKFKSLDFNNTSLWQIRFDRSGNHFAEVLGTTGFLGLLSYLALIGMFLLISWLWLRARILKFKTAKTKSLPFGPENDFLMPLLMALTALLVAQFVYYQTTVLSFMFWLVLGLSVASWQTSRSVEAAGESADEKSQSKGYSFKDFPELSLIFTLVFTALGIGLIASYFFAGRFYLANLRYAESFDNRVSAEKQIGLLEEAADLNPYEPYYKIILARLYLQKAMTELAKPQQEQDQNVLTTYVYRAISAAKGGEIAKGGQILTIKGAIELGPKRIAAWETLGGVYQNIITIANGALEWGIKTYEEALKLEPTNPVLHTELGKLYAAAGNTSKAKDEFAKAMELKSDYIEALLQDVSLDEQAGNTPEALKKLEEAAAKFPLNTDIAFQLGRFYFNAKQYNNAIAQLGKVISLAPSNSNALYALGVSYKAVGRNDMAIQVFEKVLELNPGNQDIQQKLNDLRKSK